MAAQVELEHGMVSGRLHLSPLTDSSNKSLMEDSSIISSDPKKPVPGPKPRLTPKPFAVQRNTTIRPILAPKPQPKPKPEVLSKPEPPSKPAPTSSALKSGTKSIHGPGSTPEAPTFIPEPSPHSNEPGKPKATETGGVVRRTSLGPSASRSKPTEWSSRSQTGGSITRAKSMGFLGSVDLEEDVGKKADEVVRRPQETRSSRPRPVSAYFLQDTGTPSAPAPQRVDRRPLSSDLTAKFESFAQRQPTTGESKENTPETPAPEEGFRRREKDLMDLEKGMWKKDVEAQDPKPLERAGSSIKRRISLLMDSSSSVPAQRGAEPRSSVPPIAETDGAIGVKQRIRELTEDFSTAPTPPQKPQFKPRPLLTDRTKRFASDVENASSSELKSVQEGAEELDKKPKDLPSSGQSKPQEDQDMPDNTSSGFQTVRASLFENVVEKHNIQMMEKGNSSPVKPMPRRSLSLRTKGSSLSSSLDDEDDRSLVKATYQSLESPPSPKRVDHIFDMVTAVEESHAVSENIPAAHLEEKALTLRRSNGGERPQQPSVNDGIPGNEENSITAGSSNFLKDKDRQSTGSATEKSNTRYLRVGALPKWDDTFVDRERELEMQKQREIVRKMEEEIERQMEIHKAAKADIEEDELEMERETAAPLRQTKVPGTEDQQITRPRATYFALTGQMNETVHQRAGTDEEWMFRDERRGVSDDRGKPDMVYEDFSVKSGRRGFQNRVPSMRRNTSVETTYRKSSPEELQITESREGMQWQRGQEKEKEYQREMERHKLAEYEKMKELEWQREMEKERERQREMEKERERQREMEKERERQREREVERLKELERQKQLEKERQVQIEYERRRAAERELEQQREAERQRQKELEREKERLLEEERMRLREFEKQQEMEKEKKRQMELERLQEIERQKQREFERQRELERQKEQERQKEMERRKQLEEMEKWMQSDRQKALEREKQRELDDLKKIQELERRQLLEFQLQKESTWEKPSIRRKQDKMEEAPKEQQGKTPESPLRPKVLDLDNVSLGDWFGTSLSSDQSPTPRWRQPSNRDDEAYKPSILDVDSFKNQTQPGVSLDPFGMTAFSSLDSVRTKPTTPTSGAKSFPMVNPQSLLQNLQRDPPAQSQLQAPFQSVLSEQARLPPPLQPQVLNLPELQTTERPKPQTPSQSVTPDWTHGDHQFDMWGGSQGEVAVDEPLWLSSMESPKRPVPAARQSSLEQILQCHEERISDGLFGGSRKESQTASSPSVFEPVWSPSWEPALLEPSQTQQWNTGSQEQSRARSRSVNQRPALTETSVDGPLARIRSRSAQRDKGQERWEQLKQSGQEECKDTDTLVQETDSQYGTWDTGLHTDDSLTPATPSSDSNLVPSPRKPSLPHTPDQLSPEEQLEPLNFPQSPTTLLDSSAQRSKAQLSKSCRRRRALPTRAARHSAILPDGSELGTDEWRFKDSTEDKPDSARQQDDESDEDETIRADTRTSTTSTSSQPQRVSLFPGMDPSALMAQLKKRGETESQTDGPSPTQLSRSPKSPFLGRAPRVLPPVGGKENGEESSPQWLKELKTKKRFSQIENDS